MKKILVFFLIPLFFACQKEHVLEAELSWVVDTTLTIVDCKLDDSISIRRLVHTVYWCVNKSDDSIFIPIESYPFGSHLKANIESRNTLKTSVVGGASLTKMDFHINNSGYYSAGDTIRISFTTRIDSDNNEDDEWLKNISTKELLMKIRINADSLYAMKSHLPIPRIIFNNDTSDVNINPVPIVKNRNTSK